MISISTEEFLQLANYVKSNYGINLKTEKKYLVVGRLQNLLIEKQMNNFSEYFQYVISDRTGQAVTTLLNRLTTNHTFFMREPEHFDYLRSTVFPFLVKDQAKSKDLRIWSAGCSTGEEPYTIAMILADYFSQKKSQWDTQILATDISEQAITTARKGIYLNERLVALPDHWQSNYFAKVNAQQSRVSDRIKREVIFRRYNLMQEVFPFKEKFNVIFCRNVMIYFDHPTKVALVNRFYEATASGGYLFIGHSESLNRNETRYKYLIPAVYRKE